MSIYFYFHHVGGHAFCRGHPFCDRWFPIEKKRTFAMLTSNSNAFVLLETLNWVANALQNVSNNLKFNILIKFGNSFTCAKMYKRGVKESHKCRQTISSIIKNAIIAFIVHTLSILVLCTHLFCGYALNVHLMPNRTVGVASEPQMFADEGCT